MWCWRGRKYNWNAAELEVWFLLECRLFLIVSGLFAETITSLTLADLTLRSGREGEGTILFGPEASFAWNSAGLQGGRTQTAPRFERIAGVRDVYELIRRAQRRESGVS